MGRAGTAIMANETTCLKCGAPLTDDARGGFCPKCLFAQASTGDSDVSHAGQPGASSTAATAASGSNDHASTSTATGLSLPRTFGDYALLEEIARGGMGIVYRARQVSLDRIVAVKMLLFGPLSSPEFVKRFRAEAAAAASLQHPNIVAIHEVGVHQGQQFFAMDYVEGQSLAKLLANGPLPARNAASYLKTIAEAIHYAHERGILHRDLKPSNVLIDANDQPRVTDFGLARRLEGDSELTVTGQVLGSPNYMPPEQATARRGKASRRSDVYSLGAMLYHLLTGRPPFVGEALTDTLEQLLNAEPVPPGLLNGSPIFSYRINRALQRAETEELTARQNQYASDMFRAHAAVNEGDLFSALRLLDRNRPSLGVLASAGAAPNSGVARPDPMKAGLQTDLRGWEWRYLWQQCQGDQLFILGYHSNGVSAVGFLPDGKTAYSAGRDKAVRLWDVESRQQIGLLAHDYPVTTAACSPDGRWLVTGTSRWLATSTKDLSWEGTLRLWDLATRREAAVPTNNFWFRPNSTMFSPDSQLLAFVGLYSGVHLWSVSRRQEVTNLP